MMQADWLQLLARITPAAPWNLDDAPSPTGRGHCRAEAADSPPPAAIWPRRATGGAIGIRVTTPLKDVASAAARLAAAAVERDVTPVILTPLPLSGFEQFGFRVERLPDGPAATVEAIEAELTQLWALALIVNAEDIVHLG